MLRKLPEMKNSRVFKGGTDSAPRPGDYDLGSLASRAAARMMLEGGSKPLFVVFQSSMPPWLPPVGTLRTRIRNAGGEGLVPVFTDDLGDPDLPPQLRESLALAQAQNRSNSNV